MNTGYWRTNTGYWMTHTGILTVEDMYISEEKLKKYK
jgi:hypothetical protein